MTLLDPIEALFMLALSCGMTIAIILLSRPLVARIAGANWAYALWGVLLVPPLAALAPSTVFEGIHLWSYPKLGLPVANSVQSVLLGLWLVGIVVAGSMSIRRSIQVHRRIESSSRPLSVEQMHQVEKSCARANVFPAPRTVTCSSSAGPAVTNGRGPVLVLPDDFFLKYSSSERDLILHHELIHLQRFDLVWNVLFRTLRCLLWFVPFMKHCERKFRADQERSCDHSVVCDEPNHGRADYARALYKTVIPTLSSNEMAGFRNSRHEMVIRTELLGVHRRTNTRSMTGFFALAVCFLLAVGVSASSKPLAGSMIPTSGWCSVYGKLGL